jgi:hypothetical protein
MATVDMPRTQSGYAAQTKWICRAHKVDMPRTQSINSNKCRLPVMAAQSTLHCAPSTNVSYLNEKHTARKNAQYAKKNINFRSVSCNMQARCLKHDRKDA